LRDIDTTIESNELTAAKSCVYFTHKAFVVRFEFHAVLNELFV